MTVSRERCEELARQMDFHAEQTERVAQEYRDSAALWRQRAGVPVEEREHGHTFRISVISRGSYGHEENGVTEYADADYWGPQTHVLEVRAWSLQSAMRQAAQVRFTDWGVEDEGVVLSPEEAARVRQWYDYASRYMTNEDDALASRLEASS